MSHPLKKKRGSESRFIFTFLLFLFIYNFCSAQPLSTPEDTLLFREGEILLAKGETEKALWRFKRLVTEYPQSPLLNEAKFRMGICYFRLKKPKDSIRILNELFSTFLWPTRMVQIFTLLGDNYLELKDPHNALLWYGKGILVQGPSSNELKIKVRTLIDTFDSEEELKQIESLYRGAYAGDYAKLKLTQLESLRRDERFAPTYRVGVILPLSGIGQSFGEKVLQGIQLAVKETDLLNKNSLISLEILDSNGSPHEVEKAIEELATKRKVLAILGPLLSQTAESAVRKAGQVKVPLITFFQKELNLEHGGFLFQNSITPLQQVQSLVDFAVNQSGLQSFAIFYPNSPYGFHFKTLFLQEVTQRGGKIIGVVAYQEDQTDFSEEIKGFFKFRVNQIYQCGLFIPDTHDRIGLILSQIARYNIKGLTFLGTSSWNGPGLISVGGSGAEGSLFVDAFYKRDPSLGVSRFVQEFRKTYQRDPETLEALGYDGAKFLKEILQSKKVSTPAQLKEEILQTQNFQGVSGLKGFDETGKSIRSLNILKVNQGRIEKIFP